MRKDFIDTIQVIVVIGFLLIVSQSRLKETLIFIVAIGIVNLLAKANRKRLNRRQA